MAAQENVNDVVMKLLSDVIGAEFFAEYDVSSDSTLTGDLEMESMEIVELAEKIKVYYQNKVDMSEWMAKLSLEKLVALNVGDVTEFVENATC
jgi:acyl carrier protein